MNGLFVTATGTGIGKTLVCAALACQLRARGERVRALKPVLTGVADERAADSDSDILLRALGEPLTPAALARVSPFRFAAPLAPAMAAAREGKSLPFDDLVAFCRTAAAPGERLLIEGVGGVMVPLQGRLTVLDWIAALEVPALLVAGSYLGTLSHTLTALTALATRGVPVAGIVICESEGASVGLAETAEALGSLTHGPVVTVPRLAGPEPWRAAPPLAQLLD